MATTSFSITGMHCESCKGLIEDVVMDVPGVMSCSVNQETNSGTIEHSESFNFGDLVKEIEALGPYRIAKI
ncbi:MAG: heavy metal-associated domain-containing protein [Patescibacteria group bacterium]|jgi:copper chaperone CopZ